MIHIDASRLRPSVLTPPLSKSDAQRALAIAHALGRPELAAIADLAAQPADVQKLARGLEQLRAGGRQDIDCGEGGTPLRVLLGQAAVAPAGHFRLFGSERLGQRPHRALLEALRARAEIREGNPWPIEVLPKGGAAAFRVAASESSQFATSLLLAAAASFIRDGKVASLELVGPLASEGYFELTLSWLERSGFSLRREGGRIEVAGHAPVSTLPPVPGDWSSLGYLLLIAWRSGGSVAGADLSSEHPDKQIVRVLRDAGLTVHEGAQLRVTGEPTEGIEASAADCPDLILTLAALACVLPSRSGFSEVEILRAKESDRLAGVLELLRAAGGEATHEGDQISVAPPRTPARHLRIDSRGDHRLAMAGATLAVLLGARAEISDPDCVAKSFPAFWAQLTSALESPPRR